MSFWFRIRLFSLFWILPYNPSLSPILENLMLQQATEILIRSSIQFKFFSFRILHFFRAQGLLNWNPVQIRWGDLRLFKPYFFCCIWTLINQMLFVFILIFIMGFWLPILLTLICVLYAAASFHGLKTQNLFWLIRVKRNFCAMLDSFLSWFYYALTSSVKLSFINLSRSFDAAKLSV